MNHPARFHSGDGCVRQPRHRARPRARPRTPGFTLIEVMMATVIIGLGILGLLALFAGAARQQQLASQSSTAQQATQNALSRMATLVGTLDGTGLAALPEGVWGTARSDPDDRTLTLATSAGQPVFFLVDPSEPLPATLYSEDQPMDMGLMSASVPGVRTDFAHRRVDPNTLSFEVDFIDRTLPGMPTLFGGPVVYTRANTMTAPMDTFTVSPNLFAYYRNGIAGGPGNDYILVDVQENPPDGTVRAKIESFDFSRLAMGSPDPVVTAVRAIDYKWRNDVLLSLSDRLVYRNDASHVGGRRPEIAFSVLYRRTPTASQVACVAYTLSPPANDAVFVPTDTAADQTDGSLPPTNNVTPVAVVRLTLGWDDVRQQYYFETTDNNQSWALQPGQQLLVEGTDSIAGADQAVRVATLVRTAGNAWRGYLSDSPRRSQNSYLSSRDASPVQLGVWAVRDIVRSATDGGVTPPRYWKLRVLDFQIIQLAN